MIAVSMTTISSRVESAAKAICSILVGGLRPDCLLLNVSPEPFLADAGLPEIPPCLSALPIEIAYCENYGPARKLIPALKRWWNDDALIVTADDDFLYPRSWLGQMVKATSTYPQCVVCYNARRIRAAPYRRWPRSVPEDTPSEWWLPIGNCGIAYRPGFFNEQVLDVATLRETAIEADDLWFTANRKREIQVCRINSAGPFEEMRAKDRLAEKNYRHGNDQAIARLMERGLWSTP